MGPLVTSITTICDQGEIKSQIKIRSRVRSRKQKRRERGNEPQKPSLTLEEETEMEGEREGREREGPAKRLGQVKRPLRQAEVPGSSDPSGQSQ